MFHHTWIALKLDDRPAARSSAEALFHIAEAGDTRAGRFLTRVATLHVLARDVARASLSLPPIRELDEQRRAIATICSVLYVDD